MACDVKTSGKADSEDARGAYILKRLMTEQMKEGYIMTPAQACGVVGNFYAESRYDPGAVGDHGNSHGIMQWNDGAGWGFIDYFTKKGIPWKDLKNQVDFFLTGDNETMVKERKEWIKWCKENPKASPGASANRFCIAHERPKNKETKAKEREKYADKWADWLKSNSVGDCDFSTLNETSKTESDTPSGGENSQQESVNCGNNAQQSQVVTSDSVSDFNYDASSGGGGGNEMPDKNMYIAVYTSRQKNFNAAVNLEKLGKVTNLKQEGRIFYANDVKKLAVSMESWNKKRGKNKALIYFISYFDPVNYSTLLNPGFSTDGLGHLFSFDTQKKLENFINSVFEYFSAVGSGGNVKLIFGTQIANSAKLVTRDFNWTKDEYKKYLGNASLRTAIKSYTYRFINGLDCTNSIIEEWKSFK